MLTIYIIALKILEELTIYSYRLKKKKEKVKPVNTTRPKRLAKYVVCYHKRFRYIEGLFLVFNFTITGANDIVREDSS